MDHGQRTVSRELLEQFVGMENNGPTREPA
jgi:hypothetical protein